MTGHARRTKSLLAASLVTVALAAPIAAGGANGGGAEPNPILRNDAGHFGRTTSDAGIDRGAQQPPAVVVHVDNGFDWVSAAVGAAGGVGVAILAGSAIATVRRRERTDAVALSGR